MNLNFSHKDLSTILEAKCTGAQLKGEISQVAYDSRNIVDGKTSLFFALSGNNRDGHQFLSSAYEKGVRAFVVTRALEANDFQGATFFQVNNALEALQKLAKKHRSQFAYPVIAITGSTGKTTVKEWLYHLLQSDFRIIRSPKSYNSQLGVALSLLELNGNADLAIIEAGISAPGEMSMLHDMIQPTIGIFTSFGQAHAENFKTKVQHLSEKLVLFKGVQHTFVPAEMQLSPDTLKSIHGLEVGKQQFAKELALVPFDDEASQHNALLAIAVAKYFLPKENELKKRIASLPKLALRMELFEGKHQNLIISDPYNMDFDALHQSLEYQLRRANGRKRVVLIGLDDANKHLKTKIEQIVASFKPDHFEFVNVDEVYTSDFSSSVILLKGTRNAQMQRFVRHFKQQNHTTFVELDLNALQNNIQHYRQLIKPETKLLAMVKAQAYGSGGEKMVRFIEQQGLNYLGVAFVDEGVELRKMGVQLPILVMNAQAEGFEDCVRYELEPAIFSITQLDAFIKELIFQGRSNFPVHLKLDTGMHRLGFYPDQLQGLCDLIKAQPEVRINSVYSHLADADNRRDKRFTEHQIQTFNSACEFIFKQINYSFLRHILNSDGIANFSHAQYEMVRVGIGMYGITSNLELRRKLQPVFSWYSSISQIKKIKKGESVGYGRSFIAEKETLIAVVPVGYADGFRRSLGNGNGQVIVKGKACKTIGKICMDMLMIDVTGLKVGEGDPVEIVGKHQKIEQLAQQMETIPYEVMTSISTRVQRIYLEE